MFLPLVHVSLPPLEEGNSVERHFAPLVFMLEGLIKLNEWHLDQNFRRVQIGLDRELIPPLYASGAFYAEDPPGEENWRDLPAALERVRAGKGIDCIPLDALVLRDDYEIVPLGSLRPGDRILGDGAWTRVVETIATGPKRILAIDLSNGCTLRCTPEHRIFRDVNGNTEEIRAGEARIGDCLLTPTSVPLAEREDLDWPERLQALSPDDRAWLLGVFIADGWTSRHHRDGGRCQFAISGLDGKPKEEQKRRAEQLLLSVGVPVAWYRKHISSYDRPLAEFFARAGSPARNKCLASLRFDSPAAVRSVLEGLAADAGRSETGNPESALVYGTTSPKLAIQLRVLYRMLGTSTSIRRVDNHGGLGRHAIYRVIPRLKIAPGNAERRDKKFAKIRAIADGGIAECGDIETDSGKFWLPESDVLVHNCDNLIAWRVAELRHAGYKAARPVIKWQHLPHGVAVGLGYPSRFVPESGLWLVHCLVEMPGGAIEDTSKNLGMGGSFTNRR